MGSDSISHAPLPAFSKDLGKKKRSNRLAKLKQSKLDVRREQWLSQVKNKVCKVDSNGRVESPPSSMQIADKQNRSLNSLERSSRGDENKHLSLQEYNLESVINSSFGSGIDHDDSRKNHSGSSCCSSSIRSDYCSESSSEEEDGCVDDWEAVADALNAEDNKHSPISNSSVKSETKDVSADLEQSNKPIGAGLSMTGSKGIVSGSHMSCRAWSSDDAFRPQCLPSPSKRIAFSVNSDWYCGLGATTQEFQSIVSQPSLCPICYEDLDVTDSSFIPCSCGFRLCLFCHKRILEADGRCPGCRKQYDPKSRSMGFNGEATTFKVTRSCSISTRH